MFLVFEAISYYPQKKSYACHTSLNCINFEMIFVVKAWFYWAVLKQKRMD